MSKTVIIPNGILTLAESKAECPECERQIPFDEIEGKWMKQDKHYMRMKCKCKRFIGITTDMRGDFIAFSLK
tara:strand:+ start:214 stop:429 length:216 start_codon:yes stop_codon:yes gene_type:complete